MKGSISRTNAIIGHVGDFFNQSWKEVFEVRLGSHCGEHDCPEKQGTFVGVCDE